MLGGYSRKVSPRQCKIQISTVMWESKKSRTAHLLAFREPKIQNFGNHDATSGILVLLQISRFELLGDSIEVSVFCVKCANRWTNQKCGMLRCERHLKNLGKYLSTYYFQKNLRNTFRQQLNNL